MQIQKKSVQLYMGIVITVLLMLIIFIGFFYTPFDPEKMSGSEKLLAPTATHLFGTDHFGRDVLSRVMKGAGSTLSIALGTVLIGGTTGMVLGMFTGYFGGWTDEIFMRINDILASFPSVLLALIVISVFGPGKYKVLLALGIIFIPSFTRVVRGEVLRLREEDYVKSAKLIGITTPRILFVHILPNMLPTLLNALTIGFNNAILAESGLSYLGIGIKPPDASLGRMLSESQSYLAGGPWCAIFPGVFIVLFVLGVSLLGEGVLQK